MKIKKKRHEDLWVVNGIEVEARNRWDAVNRYIAGIERDNARLRKKLSFIRSLISGLKNMIYGGRLTHADIPDDFDWLKRKIREIERDISQEG